VDVGGLTPEANRAARNLLPVWSFGSLRNFVIPGSDEAVVSGNDVEFIFKLGDLYCARVLDPTNPLSLVPWIIPIRDIQRQRAGVTILGNVVDPTAGDRVILNYTLVESGVVTVTVFSLAGDIVDVLYRGRQAAGEYNLSWNGTNRGGRAVGRGVYFVKIVAPGINEIRKVLVVKPR